MSAFAARLPGICLSRLARWRSSMGPHVSSKYERCKRCCCGRPTDSSPHSPTPFPCARQPSSPPWPLLGLAQRSVAAPIFLVFAMRAAVGFLARTLAADAASAKHTRDIGRGGAAALGASEEHSTAARSSHHRGRARPPSSAGCCMFCDGPPPADPVQKAQSPGGVGYAVGIPPRMFCRRNNRRPS